MGLKTYDYIVTLKSNTNHKVFDWITWLLIVFAIATTTVLAVTTTDQSIRIKAFVFVALMLGSGIYSFISHSPYRIALFIAFICWIFLLKGYFVAALYAICGILEKQVKFKREIGFDNDGITVNTFPQKKYKWHEVNNVVLKDGIVTVDLYNNRIIQKELENESTDDMEKEFNEFCRSHLLSV